MKKLNQGFTLVELLVVIAIIGILSSTILVSLNASRNKAKEVRILSSVRQLRSIFESDYLGSTYADLTPRGDGTQIAVISDSAPALTDIVLLLRDIGQQNGNSNVANIGSEDVDLYTDGSLVQIGPTPPGILANATSTGVVIFTTNTSGLVDDYAVYATSTAGYVCMDSSGNIKKAGEGTITGSFLSTVPLSGGRVICQ
ncbi:MAG: type II secretion system protein [Candidatus Paceibacterota bacterium]|jgi:prepilin-type N-terminal cleavage/methylation domain-containing protein